MKALVLCGGLPQIALMKELKSRGISVVLADRNEKVAGRAYADIFYPVSTLDVEGIKNVAITEKVDFLLSVCADQVLQVVAEVSEDLGLPCYIDYKTAVNVSKKSYMKDIFVKNDIPTSKHVILEKLEPAKISHLQYPLIVKPVDSYSSRGVRRVESFEELETAFAEAVEISRTKTAIVEEFVVGDELTVDVYVEEGKAHVLCISNLYKIGEDGKFVINRSRIPGDVTEAIAAQIAETAQKIADAFGLKNTPVLIQLISDGTKIAVVEFCARTGGGIKFLMIQKISGFDVVKAVLDLTMGQKPHVGQIKKADKLTVNEFVYCNPGEFVRAEGFEQLLAEGTIAEFSVFKAPGTVFGDIGSSGDRLAYFSVEAATEQELKEKHARANAAIKAVGTNGEDLIRHDLIGKFCC